uniref:adenine phosphoribosyltransferase-like isoform X1 n=2 Tax=Myxine glutinosa TaxID=7769 RepID=UPI00358EBA00
MKLLLLSSVEMKVSMLRSPSGVLTPASPVPMDVWNTSANRRNIRGWYLDLMSPNTRGSNFSWLDPSRLYCNSEALSDCIEDLCEPFLSDDIDLVVGIEAMGFILGAAAAAYFRKGFLAVRKSGHLCVNTNSEPYTDYTGKQKTMEVRTDVVEKGTRLLIVDQWIETGGTMQAAIRLMEKLGGIVIGVAAICIEETEGGKTIMQEYKTSSCVPKSLQPKFNEHCLASLHNTLDNASPMKANV